MNTTNLQIAQACDRAGEECTMPREAVLMQDENSGRDGRRYNEWHASRPDARLNAREAAAQTSKEQQQ